MKTTRKIIAIYTIILVPILIIGLFYLKFINLDVYSMTDSGITYKQQTYHTDPEEFNKLIAGEFKIDKVIGRVGESKGLDDWLFGLKVYKIEGIDENDKVWVNGLMFDNVYISN